MSLPACQERILSGIERALRAGEPRLASRFAMFTRLTRDEELPRTEQLVPEPWPWRWLKRAVTAGRVSSPRSRSGGGTPAWARPTLRLRAVVLVPLVLIVMASALVFASSSGSARTCTAAHGRPGAVATRWATCAATGAQTHGPRGTDTSGVGGRR